MKAPYLSFINAQGVVLAWLGALIGPVLVAQGVAARNALLSGFSGLLLLCVLLSLVKGYGAYRRRAWSDVTVYYAIPALLLIVGVALLLLNF